MFQGLLISNDNHSLILQGLRKIDLPIPSPFNDLRILGKLTDRQTSILHTSASYRLYPHLQRTIQSDYPNLCTECTK